MFSLPQTGLDRSSPSVRLRIYLEDHDAAAAAGLALVRRAQRGARGTVLETPLATLVAEIAEDRETLRRIMEVLEVPQSVPKQVSALAGERVGRLKLNGQVLGRSPLSNLVEVDGLVAGITAKRGLWRSLAAIIDEGLLPEDIDLDALATRADSQVERLEEVRAEVAREALAR